MLPNVLQPSATDHVPVLAHEVRESLAVEPGQTVIDATFATIAKDRLHGVLLRELVCGQADNRQATDRER